MRRAALCAACVLLSSACSFDWSAYDPREAGVGGSPTSGTGGSASGGSGGAGASSSSAGGAANGGAGGMPLGPWGTPELITELLDNVNMVSQDDACFTADALEIYINSNRPGGLGGADIWVSTRASTSDPWATPQNVPELSSPYGETNQAVAPDGLTMWLSSNREGLGMGDDDIYVSTRTTRADVWGTPVLVPELNSSAWDAVTSVSADGLTMIMESDRNGSATADELYVATRPTTGDPWSTPTLIAELNTVDSDRQAWINADATYMVFDRNVGGNPEDLFESTRASSSDSWGTPLGLADLNSAEEESDAWLSPDLRYITFTRGPAPRQIWQASR